MSTSLRLAAILLATCTGVLQAKEPPRLPGRVGVIVLVGQEIELARVGAMVFGNKRTLVPTDYYAIANLIYDSVSKHLLREGMDVVPVLVEPAIVPKLVKRVETSSRRLFGESLDGMEADLPNLEKNCTCDALLILTGGSGTDGSNQYFKPIAWVAQGNLSDTVKSTGAGAYLRFHLVEVRTTRVIGRSVSSPDAGVYTNTRPLDPRLWPTEMSTLSDEQLAAFKAALTEQVYETSRKPLFNLGLKPSCAKYFFGIRDRRGMNASANLDPLGQAPEAEPDGDPVKCGR